MYDGRKRLRCIAGDMEEEIEIEFLRKPYIEGEGGFLLLFCLAGLFVVFISIYYLDDPLAYNKISMGLSWVFLDFYKKPKSIKKLFSKYYYIIIIIAS